MKKNENDAVCAGRDFLREVGRWVWVGGGGGKAKRKKANRAAGGEAGPKNNAQKKKEIENHPIWSPTNRASRK